MMSCPHRAADFEKPSRSKIVAPPGSYLAKDGRPFSLLPHGMSLRSSRPATIQRRFTSPGGSAGVDVFIKSSVAERDHAQARRSARPWHSFVNRL